MGIASASAGRASADGSLHLPTMIGVVELVGSSAGRHCERSEAIQNPAAVTVRIVSAVALWAMADKSSLALLAITQWRHGITFSQRDTLE
jgi:hypothetical protein